MSSGINDQFLLALILALSGLGAVVWACVLAARALSTARWPSVDGSIVEVGVLTDMEMRPRGGMYGAPRPTTVSKPVVRYTYRVGDQTYTNDRLQFRSTRSDTLRAAQRAVDAYEKGQAVKVYVSPSDPSISVLEPGLHWNHVARIAMACVALVVGVVWMAYGSVAWL